MRNTAAFDEFDGQRRVAANLGRLAMNKDQADSVVLEDDLLVLASEGNEAAITELSKRGYTPADW
jgi:hypothetical protein